MIKPLCQLCVPASRRNHVLKLAHDSVFGGHMGERKIRERIKLSLYWPRLRQSVQEYVSSCRSCKLRSRVRTTDRVPITPITRADVPFQVLYMIASGQQTRHQLKAISIACASLITALVGLLYICSSR